MQYLDVNRQLGWILAQQMKSGEKAVIICNMGDCMGECTCTIHVVHALVHLEGPRTYGEIISQFYSANGVVPCNEN